MGDVVDLKTKKKPAATPEECFLRFSTPKKDGSGPIYMEWNGVSPQIILVAEAVIQELKSFLFDIIQEDGENEHDEEA
jgi:hypothetical protein